jgi:hypothetical protein
VNEGIDAISVSPDVALETILKVADAEENRPEHPEKEYERFTREDIGKAAGEIYDALNQHGEAKASALKDYTSRLNDNVREQALGWLAKEEKVDVDKEEGEITYRLN